MDSETPERMTLREQSVFSWLTDKAELVNIIGISYLAVLWVPLCFILTFFRHWRIVNLRASILQDRDISLLCTNTVINMYRTQITCSENNILYLSFACILYGCVPFNVCNSVIIPLNSGKDCLLPMICTVLEPNILLILGIKY